MKKDFDEKDSKAQINSELKEEEVNQMYLSSSDIDENKSKQKYQYEESTFNLYHMLSFLVSFIFYYIIFVILIIWIVLIVLLGIVWSIVKKREQVPILLWVEICSASISYCLVNYIFFLTENQILRDFQLDGVYFYLTSILVFSYLKTHYCKSRSLFEYDERSIFTLQYQNVIQYDKQAYFMDFPDIGAMMLSLKREMIFMKYEGYSKISLYFSYFREKSQTNKPQNSVDDFLKDFDQYFPPNYTSFFFLTGIIFVKLGFCFFYIFMQVPEISNKQYFDIFVSIFLYMYTTFNLNRILGNNDLRRKYALMIKQNQFVDFRNTKDINLKEKLDVTCPISLESWDNARKFLLAYQNDQLETLELSYFCLILYFIIALLIILSSYFELYWIIPQNSTLLRPLTVIMSIFNFIFLSAFLLIRFYVGNKFNDGFEGLNSNLIFLIDVMEDLETMFDAHFNYQKNKTLTEQENKESIYAILTKKIKLKSKFYIKNGIEFENKKYNLQEKGELRKKLLQNAKLSLEKVKRSVENDSNQHKYKFLNLIEINFNDILFTFALALVTTLPTIIPKFLNLFFIETNE